MPWSFSMNACTRASCGSQSCVPSSEQESCTMCSRSTPGWSATDAMQSFNHWELRKLGVMMENFMGNLGSNLRPKLLRDGDAPAHAERARGNFQPRRGLPPFVFAEIHLVHHVIHHRRIEAASDDFLLAPVFHDVSRQD